MNKFIFLQLKIINGEYHYDAVSVHIVPASKDTREFAEEYASQFYDRPDEREEDDDSEYYDFNAGEVAVKVTRVEDITEDEYNTLKKFI